MTQIAGVNVIQEEMEMAACERCTHNEKDHVDGICEGSRFCTCIRFERAPEPIRKIRNIEPQVEMDLRSHTDVPLPMFITTHDNWTGKGWEYKRKWGKSQKQMVKFLHEQCGLNVDEIRRFLRCKHSSVRGRLSEINNAKNLQAMIH